MEVGERRNTNTAYKDRIIAEVEIDGEIPKRRRKEGGGGEGKGGGRNGELPVFYERRRRLKKVVVKGVLGSC